MTRINKEMGVSHHELFRLLDKAVQPHTYTVSDQCINIQEDSRQVLINYAPERIRKLASFRLPVTDLELTFRGFSAEEITAFLKQFDKTYQCGGG